MNLCFVWISEQRAIISLYSFNLSVFKTEAESVYCAVRNGSLTQTYSFVLKWLTMQYLFVRSALWASNFMQNSLRMLKLWPLSLWLSWPFSNGVQGFVWNEENSWKNFKEAGKTDFKWNWSLQKRNLKLHKHPQYIRSSSRTNSSSSSSWTVSSSNSRTIISISSILTISSSSITISRSSSN